MVLTGSSPLAPLPGGVSPKAVQPDPGRALTSAGLIVYDWDLASDRIAWSANAAELLGMADIALIATGGDFAQFVEPVDGMSRPDAIATEGALDDGSGIAFAALYGIRLGTGALATVDDSGRWFAGTDGRPASAHGTMRLRPSDPQSLDAGRARSAFLAQVGHDVQEANASKKPLTLFAFALANLAELNDELGYDAADQVIETVLARLHAAMRGRDRFVRYSGNRFALALRGCGRGEGEIAAERLTRFATAEPVGTAKGPRAIRLVVGGATAPDHAVDATTLLRRAEASLGLAKRRIGPPYLMYDPGLFRTTARGEKRDRALESIELLNARRIAVACQPIVEAGSRRIAFREALLRIEDREGRIQPACDIVPALEGAGLVHLADAAMLERVADHLAATPSDRLALNVSPMTIERGDWLPVLSAHLGARPGIASRLIVEVTETAAIRDAAGLRASLEAAKALGVSIAIDDFGAGHTSFRHLRGFPVDFLKIDGAFIQNLARSPDDQYFVRTLLDLAHHLGIATIAEWVEDEESAQLLASWGADYLQGDHCGRPELINPAAPGTPSSRVA